MRPRIGIPCSPADRDDGRYTLRKAYVEAVFAAGGLPLLIPSVGALPTDEIARSIDGLLLPGGTDLDPEWYGEEPLVQNGWIDPTADGCEIELCRRFLEEGRPVFGICKGVQVLNVAAGGDLYQDLATQVGSTLQHFQRAPRWHATHEIELKAGSRLARLIGKDRIRVNSFHHQAVRRVGEGLAVAATARDGVIEAIEGTGSPFVLGVQWHPEGRYKESEADMALFRVFIEASAQGGPTPAGADLPVGLEVKR